MKATQNLAIQPQQVIVEDLIDLDRAKKLDGKFVEFIGDDYRKNPPGFEYPYDVQFKDTGMHQFRCDSLESAEITINMRLSALKRLSKALEYQLEKEIKQDHEIIKRTTEIKSKFIEKNKWDLLNKSILNIEDKIFQEILERGSEE